jgi:hypothetical protein
MKKLLYALVFLLAACTPSQAVTVAAPTQIMNQFPTPMPTPTLAVVTRPMTDEDQQEAFNFFYEQKNNIALVKYDHFAEEIRYPITVRVDGESLTLIFAAEVEANFERIFSQEAIQKIISTDESELVFTANGVKVADGIFWFDLICMDADCEEAEFLITEINNATSKGEY